MLFSCCNRPMRLNQFLSHLILYCTIIKAVKSIITKHEKNIDNLK